MNVIKFSVVYLNDKRRWIITKGDKDDPPIRSDGPTPTYTSHRFRFWAVIMAEKLCENMYASGINCILSVYNKFEEEEYRVLFYE